MVKRAILRPSWLLPQSSIVPVFPNLVSTVADPSHQIFGMGQNCSHRQFCLPKVVCPGLYTESHSDQSFCQKWPDCGIKLGGCIDSGIGMVSGELH